MLKKLFLTIFTACVLMPTTVLAVGSGFVPSTGLWFSKTNFAPGEMVYIYTVVVNPDYIGLSGTVGFYDNNELVDKVIVTNLPKDQAKQLKVAWTPVAGDHTVSARFTEVYSVDAAGKQAPINPSAITVTAGAPLVLNNLPVVPETTLGQTTITTQNPAEPNATPTTVNNTVALGATSVVITKTNNELVLSPAKSSSVTEPQTTPTAESQSSFSGALSNVDELYQKNRDALQKAGSVVSTITTTAAKVESVYNQTQAAIETGKTYYQKAQDIWQKIAPYLEQAKPIWMWLSNNNEPKRIFIIIGVVVVLYMLLKFRRRRYNEFYDR